MSEITSYKEITLGETEQLFIILFGQRSFSAWDLWSQMKVTKPMSYPNTYRKIKRLYELGLLEEVKGDFGRGAIPYKLTTRGLFERLTLTGWYAINPSVWYDYRDNIILQTILYRFFETQTIWKLRQPAYMGFSTLISQYLRNCCKGILTVRSEPEVEKIIMDELKSVILKLVIASSIESRVWDNKVVVDRPSRDLYLTLRRDKKFFPFVKEMKGDFDRGCKVFGI